MLRLTNLVGFSYNNKPYPIYFPTAISFTDGQAPDYYRYFPNVNIGVPHPSRRIFVVAANDTGADGENPAVIGITIDGVAMDLVIMASDSSSGRNSIGVYTAMWPTGSSAYIVTQYSDNKPAAVGLYAFSFANLRKSAATGTASIVDSGGPISVPFENDDFVFGAAMRSDSSAFAWTGINEITDNNIGGNTLAQFSIGYIRPNSASPLSVTATPTGSGGRWTTLGWSWG